MKCPFCNWPTRLDRDPLAHLIVTVDHDHQTHVHGPQKTPQDRQWIVKMIADIAEIAGIGIEELPKLIEQQTSPEQRVTIQ